MAPVADTDISDEYFGRPTMFHPCELGVELAQRCSVARAMLLLVLLLLSFRRGYRNQKRRFVSCLLTMCVAQQLNLELLNFYGAIEYGVGVIRV